MPSLLRFLAVIGVVLALLYGSMLALVNWYEPKAREMSVSVPPDKFTKQR